MRTVRGSLRLIEHTVKKPLHEERMQVKQGKKCENGVYMTSMHILSLVYTVLLNAVLVQRFL